MYNFDLSGITVKYIKPIPYILHLMIISVSMKLYEYIIFRFVFLLKKKKKL